MAEIGDQVAYYPERNGEQIREILPATVLKIHLDDRADLRVTPADGEPFTATGVYPSGSEMLNGAIDYAYWRTL